MVESLIEPVKDRDEDGLVENPEDTRGITIRDADGEEVFRAESLDDGTGQQVLIPVDLFVDGQTSEIEDVITGSLVAEDGNTVLFRADAVADDRVEIDGDLVVTGEISEGQTL